ncbi:MAG: YaiI/YqxD family protein [Rhizobiaceae bacterium]
MTRTLADIYVDADACPVKPEILKVAERRGLKVVFVANGGLRPSRDPMVENVIVGAGFDAADDWIAARAGPGDVVVTADVPLAARCVKAGATVIGPTGRVFSEEAIGMALAMRNLNQDLREAGAISGHNAAFAPRDRSAFLQALEQAIRRAAKSAKRGSEA